MVAILFRHLRDLWDFLYFLFLLLLLFLSSVFNVCITTKKLYHLKFKSHRARMTRVKEIQSCFEETLFDN